ncbi:transcriptional regulator [Burkholderia pseudomallei]|uniref:Transcriptional regulatory component of sensory transduction system n=2 Tax=Burkholderia pseudomallei TaxID=28450 RepID=Q3JM80_BURP1|nr:transcriptional regulatory component of sensory transduction system [Burkholderia pseudomallei 1710b]AYX04209.1 transcriptional regulator [Burkholderia pseudomallei]MBD2916221.1 transcriptional regulator [Burkholderia pseudomallei]MBD2928588.1 transcriptional regulator [Burkholderia pseudomallei]MBD2934834.1 transcriptional regulator [Burkholderia pseudomallei]
MEASGHVREPMITRNESTGRTNDTPPSLSNITISELFNYSYKRRFLIANSIDFDPKTGKLHIASSPDAIPLTSLSARLLSIFCTFPGNIIDRDIIMEILWASRGMIVTDNTLTKAISHLRIKLNVANKDIKFISTLNRIGYIFVADVTPID